MAHSLLQKLQRLDAKIFENFPLKNVLTYRIGGPADFLVVPQTKEAISQCVDLCQGEEVPLTLIGSGSNLLVRDGGIRGVVLFLGWGLPGEIEVLKESTEEARIRVPAHVPKATLANWALSKGWSGLEFSAGIPGTLGGAVFMNAGTKWGSYGDIIESVQFYHPKRGFYSKVRSELGFKYRGHGEGMLEAFTIVISVDCCLRPLSDSMAIAKTMDEILVFRGTRQPLELPNCGSVFKNPMASESKGLGAGRMIEACGLKGTRVGGAQVSEKHANFILNLGEAKSSDVETLMELLEQKVLEKFQVKIEREVIVLGDFDPQAGPC